MAVSKRRKTGKASGSRSNSRATTPVPTSRPQSPSPSDSAPNKSSKNEDSLPPLVLTSEKRRGVYECDYCHTDISQLPRIRCAECPDFDLCLECFLTTDHSAAIARFKAAEEARTAVDRINAGGSHAQHQGKQAPIGSSGGGNDDNSASLSTAWHMGLGAINHDGTHGYRVCDNTRYPMFPSSRKVVLSRPNSVINDGGGGTGSARGSDDGREDEKDKEASTGKQEDAMEMDDTTSEAERSKANHDAAATTTGKEDASVLSHDVMLVADDPKAVWTVEEDLRLLDGIKTHGLGNWVDISEAVSGQGSIGKTPKRCMERYFDDFLGRYGYILPPYTLVDESPSNDEDNNKGEGEGDDNTDNKDGDSTTENTPTKDMDPTRLSKRRHSIMVRTTSSAAVQSMNRLAKKLKPVPTETLPEYERVRELFPNPKVPKKDPPVERGQEVGRDLSYKAELDYVKKLSTASTKEEEEEIRKYWLENKYMKPGGPTVLPANTESVMQLPGSELAGFMPRRGDFDIEWENEAEQSLADMEFLPGDLPEDKELKLQVLKIYNEKLDEREKRKKFILSRNLHNYRKNQEEMEKLPRDEQDLVKRMRLFERFHTPEEHQQFIHDILKAKRLRKEIAKLQMYRRMGITSMAEAERYEKDKGRRQFHKMAYLRESAAKDSAAKDAAVGAAGDASAPAATADEASGQAKSSLWKQYKTSDRNIRRRSASRGTTEAAPTASAEDAMNTEPPAGESTKKDDGDGDAPKAMEVDNEPAELENPREEPKTEEDSSLKKEDENKSEENGFALEEMEDYDKLSEKEADLLRKIRLTPKQYMDVKKVLIHESLRSGLLDKEGSRRTVVMIDVEKRGDVIDFMVKAGWVKSKVGALARTISE